MTTEALIERLLEASAAEPATAAFEVLHQLLDDSTSEASAVPLGIADAAALVGLSAHTLRYYETQGLVHPARNASGHRIYSTFDLRRLVFLTRMRSSGMTMHDLKRYIALVEEGEHTIADRREIMLAQRERIQRQLRELNLALATTEYKIRAYGGHPRG